MSKIPCYTYFNSGRPPIITELQLVLQNINTKVNYTTVLEHNITDKNTEDAKTLNFFCAANQIYEYTAASLPL